MPVIKQTFKVNHPRSIVWEKFQDLPLVVDCIPGASLVEPPQDGEVKGRMTVKLGPVKADFTGDATLTTDAANYTGTISGAGLDKSHSSRAKGKVEYRLAEVDGGAATAVTVDVDYTLAGSLAQFARGGIVDAVADQICRDFAANLEDRLNAGAPLVAAEIASGDSSSEPQHTSAPATQQRPARRQSELNVLTLLWSIVRTKLGRLFARR